MTILRQLADRALAAIGDTTAAEWDAGKVEGWLREAIRDYSQPFPRLIDLSIACVTDDRKYDLPVDFLAMVSVEYPGGDDPPVYLPRRPFERSNFWGVGGYDIIERGDGGTAAELWIGVKPTTGETIEIQYQAYHAVDLDSDGTLTVPEHHEPILIAFVVWTAWIEIASREMQSPTSNSSLIMAQMNQNARDAEARYRRLLDAETRRAGNSRIATWRMDQWDQVY